MRLRYLDIAKGIGIWGVVAMHFHLSLPVWAFTIVGCFTLPIFYVVSGWITCIRPPEANFKDYARAKARALLLPYLYWSIILIIFDTLLIPSGHADLYIIAREIYKTFTGRGIGTLWFLPALFFGLLAFKLLRPLKSGWQCAAFTLLLLYHWGYEMLFDGKTDTLWRLLDAPFRVIDSAAMATVGIMAGYVSAALLRHHTVGGVKTLSSAALILTAGVTLCLNGRWISPLTDALIMSWLPSALISLGIILICHTTAKLHIWDFFDYWGRNSLSLMLIHYSVTIVIMEIVVTDLLHLEFAGRVSAICFFLSIPIQYAVTTLINRYSPWLLNPPRIATKNKQ